MKDIAFIHDYILDSENQMAECLDKIQYNRYRVKQNNLPSVSAQLHELCDDMIQLAQELQEKLKETD